MTFIQRCKLLYGNLKTPIQKQIRGIYRQNMTNKEYIYALSEQTGYSLEEAAKMLRTMVERMGQVFDEGESVFIQGFGTFELKKRLERVMTNPSNGQRMLVPPKVALGFKPVAAMKEKIKMKS